MMLDQIKTAALSDFETKRRGQGVTAGTVRRDLACLSSLLTSAGDWESIEDGVNPVPAYLRRRAKRGLKEAPPRTRYLSENGGGPAALETQARTSARRLILAVETGLRRGELFGLTWAQIDFARGRIDTTTRKQRAAGRGTPRSTARARTIVGTAPRRLDVPFVLVNPDTETRYVQMNKGLEAARRRASLPDPRWHDLRRTAGCRWLQRDGKTMAEVSLLLGHSSVAVTEQRYAFLESETVAEFAQRPHKNRITDSGFQDEKANRIMTYTDEIVFSDSVNLGSNPSSPAN